MRWMALVVLVLAVALGVGLLVVTQRLWKRAGRRSIASYEEIKRRIRAGEAEAATRGPSRWATQPGSAKPLDEIFRLQGADFVEALGEHAALRAERAGVDRLSPSEAALLDVADLEAEVNNGGFDQYFFNSSGDRAHEALAGLELIGAAKTAVLLRRAMATFGPQGPSPSRRVRWEQMDRWTPKDRTALDDLDAEFFAYPDPISELLERHGRAHREAFTPE